MHNHIIHRQRVVLNVRKMEQSFTAQNAISKLLKEEMPALLEQAFDEITPDGETLRIDALQLDLGIIPLQNVAQVFKAQLIQAIKNAVIAKKENAATDSGTTVLKPRQSQYESLLYFLQYGTMPWYNTINSIAEWEDSITQQFTTANWHNIKRWLQENIHKKPVILQRLAAQFSDTFLIKLLNRIAPVAHTDWNEIYKDLQVFYQQFSSKKASALRAEIWSGGIAACLSGKSNDDAFYRIIENAFNKSNIPANDVIEQIISTIQTTIVRVAIKEVMNSLRFSPIKNNKEKEDDKDKAGIEDNATVVKEHEKKAQKNKPDNAFIINEAPYVNNCGVVLLHPFMEAYFEELQLLREHRFIDVDACKRGVLLLHYLATGQTAVAEFNVPLQKVLCNLPLEETLPPSLELTDEEITESKKLLQSVIDYCAPLRNTSIEGLQNTFLQREGKLEIKESGWRLTVEQKTVDILLEKLPWGFSTIHLPWMNNILSVDWC